MPTTEEIEAENAKLRKELSDLKDANRQLKEKLSGLEEKYKLVVEDNKQLHEELASLKTTVSAVVARSIGAKGKFFLLIKSQEETTTWQEKWS